MNDQYEVDLVLMNEVFDKYSGQKGALIPILQQAQNLYGYLPREVLLLIADQLGVSLGKVYGVATFYAQFYLEKRGRHILKLCDGTACHVKGTPILIKASLACSLTRECLSLSVVMRGSTAGAPIRTHCSQSWRAIR